MVLRAGYFALALQMQEAADVSHRGVAQMLDGALRDAHRSTGDWASYLDHTGDGESGDVMYSAAGSTMACPYAISKVGDKHSTNLDLDNKRKVQPVTTYQDVADEDDNYTAMEADRKRDGLYLALPSYERFISKDERGKASEDDFAGKGKSFPILKPGDVQAAIHAMGRAGSGNLGMAALKARIISIAKRKGWTAELPKAWQETTSTEAARTQPPAIVITESTVWPNTDTLALIESAAGVEKEVKIIAPGKGSSAFYTESALKASGPKVFKAGTQMFVNHATRSEEAERPEGDWNKLVGATTTDAVYHESHAQGPGLYAKAKFVSNLAPEILEKAKLGTGLSIRANGRQAMEAGRPKMQDGLPVLSEFTSCESIDLVTRAGAGGRILLTESARIPDQNNTGEAMTITEQNQLHEASRLVLHESARRAAVEQLANSSLMERGKNEVIARALESIPTKDGLLDTEKFKEAVKAHEQRVGEFLAGVLGTGNVMGMGMGGGTNGFTAPKELTAKEAKRARKDAERLQESKNDIFAGICGDSRAAAFAARGRAA